MSVVMEEEFKRWTAKRKAALVVDIIPCSNFHSVCLDV